MYNENIKDGNKKNWNLIYSKYILDYHGVLPITHSRSSTGGNNIKSNETVSMVRVTSCSLTTNSPAWLYKWPPYASKSVCHVWPENQNCTSIKSQYLYPPPASLWDTTPKLRARNLVYAMQGRLIRLYIISFSFDLSTTVCQHTHHTHTNTRFAFSLPQPTLPLTWPKLTVDKILTQFSAAILKVWFVKHKSLLCHFHLTRMSLPPFGGDTCTYIYSIILLIFFTTHYTTTTPNNICHRVNDGINATYTYRLDPFTVNYL